jgi:hypothetical protein
MAGARKAPEESTSLVADLDKVVSPNIYVQLEGVKHALPGDSPSELLLRITLLSEQLEEAVEAKEAERMLEIREEISDNVEDLFRLRNPLLEENSINLSDVQVGELVSKLFAHYYGAAIEDARAEAEAEAAGTRPTQAEEEAETPTSPSSRSEKPSPASSSQGAPRRRRRSSTRSRSSASQKT